MKEDHHYHHNRYHQRKLRNLLSNPHCNLTVCIFLIILSYILGYFSATTKSSISSPPKYNTHLTVLTAPPTVSSPPPPQLAEAEAVCPDNTHHNRFGSKCAQQVRPNQVRQKILDKIFDGTSPYENFPPAHLTRLLQPNKVMGWGSYGAVFETLIRKVKPKTIIELGTFLGASAIHMAELTRKLGLETQILCLDDFRGWPGFRDKINYISILNADVLLLPQFLQNVMHFNATGTIIPLPFSTAAGLEKLCEWGVMADLIEVDADHDFHSAWVDINRAHKLLRPSGVLFGHDYFNRADNRGVRRAVDLFARINGFKVTVNGEHWVIDSSLT